MSKLIKMTEQYINECRADFEKALLALKLADGRLSFTKTFDVENKKAEVCFTGEAWTKLVLLLKNFDKEVAWHGVAHRDEDESKNRYIISDIIVYPQRVTGASVEMDTDEYAVWLMKNAEDERFNNIRMQGHSHVNMSTTPSGVDLSHQEEILNMLGEDDFYIFMIWNKSFISTNKIYDMKKNILFEDKDISVKISGASEDFEEFVKNAKEMVKDRFSCSTYGGYGNGVGVGYPYNPVSSSKGPEDKSAKYADQKSGSSDKKKKARTKADSKFRSESIWDEDDLYGYYYGLFGSRGY